MRHSGDGDITSSYIGAYPLAKMLKYNHNLLNGNPKEVIPVVDKKALLKMLYFTCIILCKTENNLTLQLYCVRST